MLTPTGKCSLKRPGIGRALFQQTDHLGPLKAQFCPLDWEPPEGRHCALSIHSSVHSCSHTPSIEKMLNQCLLKEYWKTESKLRGLCFVVEIYYFEFSSLSPERYLQVLSRRPVVFAMALYGIFHLPFKIYSLLFCTLFHVLGNWPLWLPGTCALWLSVGFSQWRAPLEDGRWEWDGDIHSPIPNPHFLLVGLLFPSIGRPYPFYSLFLQHCGFMTPLFARHRWPHHLLEVSLNLCIP